MSDDVNPFASPQTSGIERPEVLWATEQPEALRKVKIGLTLVYASICGILLAVLGGPIVMITLAGPENFVLVGVVLGVVTVLLNLMMIVGQVLCLAVPAESGAKPLINAAVGLQGLAFVCTLLTFALSDGPAAIVVVGISYLANAVSLICFILFLRRVALYIQRPDIAGRAMRALVVGLVSVAVLAVAGILVSITPNPALGLIMLPAMLGMLIGFVMYANTVTYLRKAISV